VERSLDAIRASAGRQLVITALLGLLTQEVDDDCLPKTLKSGLICPVFSMELSRVFHVAFATAKKMPKKPLARPFGELNLGKHLPCVGRKQMISLSLTYEGDSRHRCLHFAGLKLPCLFIYLLIWFRMKHLATRKAKIRRKRTMQKKKRMTKKDKDGHDGERGQERT
jgi:hypothetical protein